MCAFVGTHVKARVPSLQDKGPPSLFSDSLSEAEVPGRSFSPIQEEGASGEVKVRFPGNREYPQERKCDNCPQVILRCHSFYILVRLPELWSQHEGETLSFKGQRCNCKTN